MLVYTRFILINGILLLLHVSQSLVSTQDLDLTKNPITDAYEFGSDRIIYDIQTFYPFLEAEFKWTLKSTNSTPFFLPGKSDPNCQTQTYSEKIPANQFTTVKISKNNKFYYYTNNIYGKTCPLSVYEFTSSLLLENLTVLTNSGSFVTDYDNVDCSGAKLTLVGRNRRRITWSQSNSLTDSYNLLELDGPNDETILPDNVDMSNNYAEFLNLKDNTEYDFYISTVYQQYESWFCRVTVDSGNGCPEFNSNSSLIKNKAPYPETIEVLMSSDIFSSIEYINYYNVYVGDNKDCSINKDSCLIAKSFTTNDLYDMEDLFGSITLELGQNAICNNSDLCEISYKYDKDYYVTVHAYSVCGEAVSSSLIVNIPSPFPINTAMIVIITVSVFIAAILLAIVFVLTYNHMKTLSEEGRQLLAYQEESEHTMDKKQYF